MRIAFLIFVLSIYSNYSSAQTDEMKPIRGIAIYIDYETQPHTMDEERLDSILNGVTYTEEHMPRSLRKYWIDESRRNVDITHDIFFYRSPYSYGYHQGLTWREEIDTWREALEWVVKTYPDYDWDKLTRNEEGRLQCVTFLSEEWGIAGWGGAHYPWYELSNGVPINAISGSLLSFPGQDIEHLFILAHESGHSFFRFPDTYDTDVTSNGTSIFSLMSGGSTDLEPIGGPFYVEQEWGYVIKKDPGEHNIRLRADGDSVFVYRNPHDPSEFFTVEARKRSTLGNSTFPAPIGLLVWHTDNKVHTSNTQESFDPVSHYRHSIEQADGLFELEGPHPNRGDRGDLFLPGRNFTPMTTPNSNWWNGELSNFELKNVEIINEDYIQFDVVIPELHEDHYPIVPRDDWFVIDAPSGQSGHYVDLIHDGDSTTYYHIPWNNNFPRPHDIVIFLGDDYTVNEFYFQANNNWTPPWEGRVEGYELYLSEDLDEWGDPIASGRLFRTEYDQYIPTEVKSGRYLKFSALSSYDDDPRTSVAEIKVRGLRTSILNNEDLIANQLKVYPNPVSNYLNIVGDFDNGNSFQIIDAFGRVQMVGTLDYTTIDVNDLISGIYTILLFKEHHQLASEQFIKID